MKVIKFCLISILFSPLLLDAQTNSATNVGSSSDNFISFSIGEIFVVPYDKFKNETLFYPEHLHNDQFTNSNKNIASSSDIEILAYPNPVSDFITISSPNNYTILSCIVFDSKNMVVLNPNPHSFKIDFRSLKAGNYVLKIIYANGIAYHPIVKL